MLPAALKGKFINHGILYCGDPKYKDNEKLWKSKYSFTDVTLNAKWIINNLNLKNQLVEVGATDFIELNKLAKLINSTSEFCFIRFTTKTSY